MPWRKWGLWLRREWPAPEAVMNQETKYLEALQAAEGGMLLRHPPDDRSNLGIDLWLASPPSLRAVAPEQTKASTMPSDQGFGFHKDEHLAPCRPKAAERSRTRSRGRRCFRFSAPNSGLEPKVVVGMEESTESGGEANEKWNIGSVYSTGVVCGTPSIA